MLPLNGTQVQTGAIEKISNIRESFYSPGCWRFIFHCTDRHLTTTDIQSYGTFLLKLLRIFKWLFLKSPLNGVRGRSPPPMSRLSFRWGNNLRLTALGACRPHSKARAFYKVGHRGFLLHCGRIFLHGIRS